MRRLRLVVPAIILGIGALLVVATFFQPFRLITPFPIDPGKVSIQGTKVTMELPRVTGFTSDQRPYELIANTAVQDLAKLDLLELHSLRAKVETKDGQHINLTSISGLYDTKAEVLRLFEHIVITTSSGYEAHLSEATAQTAKGVVTSDHPVDIKLPNGFLHANRLEVRDNGAYVRFHGGVDLTLNPEQIHPADGSTAQDQPQELPPRGETTVAQQPVTQDLLTPPFAQIPPMMFPPAQAAPAPPPPRTPLPPRRVPSPQ